jgi:(p)ppGpp synthase/HD superfamily hydrolase
MIPSEGEEASEHLETMFPLWYRQKTLLKTLNEERRRRHRELMNNGRKQRTFKINDIVVVRKQVKSKEGQPAKLTLRTKGPYIVIEKAGKNSYHIQKIPAIQSRTKRPGKLREEAVM